MTGPSIAIPRTQALHSKSFKAPIQLLEDPEETVLELYKWNAEHNANHPLFRFQDGDDIQTIYWGETVHAIRRAATSFKAQVHADSYVGVPPVVAIFANSGM